MLDTIPSTDLVDEIRADIDHNRIRLPTLPEVALRVRDAVASDSADANRIARIVSCDPALAARLLQVANSPLYAGRREVDSLHEAVTRLGLRMVRSLVTSLVMKQLFQASSQTLKQQFRKIWETSVQVAAISRLLAEFAPSLEGEEAMLGGLVHNIGALPLLTRFENCHVADGSPRLIAMMIDALAPELGTQILKSWRFVDSLAIIPGAVVDPQFDSGPTATYADIVLVARLQHLALQPDGPAIDWPEVPALAKLGLQADLLAARVNGSDNGFAEVHRILAI
jgi:HD-like signal output (HDOD) protein